MPHKIVLLGATGSIGRQTVDVCRSLGIGIAAITARRNVGEMEQLARCFKPRVAAMMEESAARELKLRLADTPVRVLSGPEGLLEAAREEADTVVTAVMGTVGLIPTLEAIQLGRRIALANKETLVCAGTLVMEAADRCGAEIIPVDSEHSAIFQCLQGCRDRGEVKRLILTASGGPFFGRSREELAQVRREDALKHPNWDMGAKITVDSATLMNKGLEFIEAMRLYRLPPEKISILVHRESIVHSLVEFEDNAILAQLGVPDMRLPIQYALTWPKRLTSPAAPLDLASCPPLSFCHPDPEAFRCLGIAMEAARRSQEACAVMNGANEVAVARFLAGEIGFLQIPEVVEHTLGQLDTAPRADCGLDRILDLDRAARTIAEEWRN